VTAAAWFGVWWLFDYRSARDSFGHAACEECPEGFWGSGQNLCSTTIEPSGFPIGSEEVQTANHSEFASVLGVNENARRQVRMGEGQWATPRNGEGQVSQHGGYSARERCQKALETLVGRGFSVLKLASSIGSTLPACSTLRAYQAEPRPTDGHLS